MELFGIVYLCFSILLTQKIKNLLVIGLVVILITNLVSNKKIVFRIVITSIILSTIVFCVHEKIDSEYKFVYNTHEFSAVITEDIKIYEEYTTAIAKVTIDDTNFKTKLYFDEKLYDISVSDYVNGTGYITIPKNSGGFDKETYYKSNDINVFLYVNDFEIEKNQSINRLNFFANIFDKIQQNSTEVLGYNSNMIINGLTLGDKSLFTSEISSDISKIGISHVFAVSGMHIGFLALLTIKIFGKRFGSGISLFVIIFYMCLIGISPSILRSIIMQVILIFAWYFDYEYESKNAVWCALVIMIITEPYLLYNASFVLSFSSTISIIYLYKHVFLLIKSGKYFIDKYILSVVTLSLCAFVGTFIPIYFYYDYFSVLNIVSNIFIAPIIAILFPICVIFSVFGLFNISIGLEYVIEFIVNILLKIISIFSSFKYAIVDYNFKIIALLGIIIVLTVLFRKNRYKKHLFVLNIAIFYIFSMYSASADYHEIKMTVFNVSDGHASVIMKEDYVVVVDCGSSSYQNAGEQISEYLYKYGQNDIDLLIITSIDKTHTRDIFDINVPILDIIYPEKATNTEYQELLENFIQTKNINTSGEYPDFIEIYDNVDKKLGVKVYDTLFLHSFTNLMLEKLDVSGNTVVLADKVISDYKKLETFLIKSDVLEVILSNDYDKLSRVSGVLARTTVEYGNIKIKNGGYHG